MHLMETRAGAPMNPEPKWPAGYVVEVPGALARKYPNAPFAEQGTQGRGEPGGYAVVIYIPADAREFCCIPLRVR